MNGTLSAPAPSDACSILPNVTKSDSVSAITTAFATSCPVLVTVTW